MPSRDPSRSNPPSSDITSDYNDIGGGVNPFAYKGHLFPPNSYSYYTSSTYDNASNTNAPPSFKLAARRAYPPNYNIPDDEDEMALSMKVPPAIPIPLTPPVRHLPTDVNRQEAYLCCPLLGPVTPFLASISLRMLGSSTILPRPVFMVWRVFLLFVSLAAFITTAITQVRFLAYIQGGAIMFSVFAEMLLLRACLAYWRERMDPVHAEEPMDAYGYVSSHKLCKS